MGEIIEYSDSIIEDGRGNVPSVVKLHGVYHQATQQYILDNSYTLNANNYTTYELMWLHAMIYSGIVVLKGKLAFEDDTIDSGEQYLLLHLIHNHLEFRYKAAAYTAENLAIQTEGTFTWYVRQNATNLLLVIEDLLLALFAVSLGSSLSILTTTAVCVAVYLAIDIATSLFINLIIIPALTPTAIYFDNVRTLGWCSKTNDMTSQHMKEAFENKLMSKEEDIAPRNEFISEKLGHMWNSFFAVKAAPTKQSRHATREAVEQNLPPQQGLSASIGISDVD